eukprot:scaffold2215_cov162-Amphora_coffeaeformis.AAC.17
MDGKHDICLSLLLPSPVLEEFDLSLTLPLRSSSGTILDLPYLFLADGMQEQMQPDPDFDFGPLITMVSSFAKLGFEGLKKLHKQGKVRRKKERQWLKNRLGL